MEPRRPLETVKPWLAERLNVTSARAYELVRTGVVPSVRLGRQVRVDPAAVERWIAAGGTAANGGPDTAAEDGAAR
jgi:excisionase family DNA binding protein